MNARSLATAAFLLTSALGFQGLALAQSFSVNGGSRVSNFQFNGVTVASMTSTGDFTMNSLKLNQTTVTINGQNMFLVPSGALMFFNGTSCPNGWTDFAVIISTNVSFYPVIRGQGVSTGTIVGNGLQDSENRPVGQHTHSITDPGHTHNLTQSAWAAVSTIGVTTGASTADGGATSLSATSSHTTGITINNSSGSGGVAGTNAPFIQLLMCQKN